MHGGDSTDYNYRTSETSSADNTYDLLDNYSDKESEETKRKKREHKELQRRARALYKKGKR